MNPWTMAGPRGVGVTYLQGCAPQAPSSSITTATSRKLDPDQRINHQPQLGNGPPADADTAFLPALNLAATPDQVQQHVGLGAHVFG